MDSRTLVHTFDRFRSYDALLLCTANIQLNTRCCTNMSRCSDSETRLERARSTSTIRIQTFKSSETAPGICSVFGRSPRAVQGSPAGLSSSSRWPLGCLRVDDVLEV
ncbi:hypothetical protein DENSPDRAFT_620175 [Dentipellis sp. KUC8613]|nr:hypothetical protein DENSPDRAFT_620175 [Dentipellis sp. KUC8613]